MCALAALVLSFSPAAFSQAVTGTVLGTVTDTSAAVVNNAKVTLTEVDTNSSRSATTNESGNFTFPNTPQGNYSVTVELEGFKKEIRQNIGVVINQNARVDVQLQPGNISQSVEVTAAPPALQTDRSDTAVSLSSVQTENLPAGTNRNFQGLLNLVPGTTRATFQHSQFFNAASSLQTEVNGQMRMGNNYQIEGIDDNERTGLLQIIVPPIESIQTVDVSTSNFDAELGRASGAVTNVILKSGTNQIHGAGYEFLQNSDLNARNFFNASVGHLAYNYFGGNIGGPIVKNKLFYFGDFLRVSDHEANANTLTIPTPAQISGNLSGSKTTIYDPSTGNPDGTGRTPFAGNIIQPNRINPVSAALMSLLPAPNLPSSSGTNNYFVLLPYHKNTNSFDVKVDDNITDKDRLSVRLSFARPEVFQAPAFGLAGGPAQGAFAGTGLQRTYSGGINYNRVFSPTLIAEFRAGVAYYNNIATPTDYGSSQSTALGIPGINLNQVTSGLVGINLSPSTGAFYTNPTLGYSASLPWTRAEANIDLSNTWTKILGNHTIKFGVDYRSIRDALLQEQTFSPRGLYTFAAGQTSLNRGSSASANSYLNSFASFLLDLPNQAGRDLATYFPSIRGRQFFSFVQDRWVVTPKLTLNVGVRWELYPPYTPQFPGGLSNYNPVNNTLVVAGVGGNPSNLGLKNHLNYLAPRFGAAYRLTEKTVFRAGFGISYTPFPDNTYAYNYPVRANNEYDSLTSFVPALLNTGLPATFQNGFPAAQLPTVPASGILSAPKSQSYFTVSPQFKNPYVESWNFAIQQALGNKFTLDMAYVGNHGVDSVVNYNLNAGLIPGAGAAGQPEFPTFGRTASTNLFFAPYSTSYNALQLKLDRHFAAGFTLTTAYTWGKGMAFQSSDDGGLDFYVNQQRNYARNDYDRTQTFVQSYVYELPFGPGKRWLRSGLMGNLLGNWRASGVLTWMSGTPFTVTADGTALNLPSSIQTANQLYPVAILGGVGPNSPWFTPVSFAQPTGKGVAGNTGRNILTGPSFFNLDASLAKIVSFHERYRFELRGEAFSITNTPQFANPNSAVNNVSNFGYITATQSGGGSRLMQIGAKFEF
jgi:Carboxypeptidase regulatory-like domain